MAVTYTCDKCRRELTNTDMKGGAHRLKIEDVIPWASDSRNRSVLALDTTWDLCDACLQSLRAFMTRSET